MAIDNSWIDKLADRQDALLERMCALVVASGSNQDTNSTSSEAGARISANETALLAHLRAKLKPSKSMPPPSRSTLLHKSMHTRA